MPSLPTIVLVPGAWHSPHHYLPLTTRLEAAGFPLSTSALPSITDPDAAAVTTTTDADFIARDLLAPLLDQGRDVVLIAHSYGGSPASVAARGCSRVARAAEGLPGGVVGIVFIAALIAPEGASLKQMVGGEFDPWVQVDTPPGFLTPSTPIPIFYNDVAPALAADAVAHLRPVSQSALSTPAGPPGWSDPGYAGRRAYIRTAQDQTLPVFAQDGMMAASGVDWEVKRLDAGHSPFLSQPEELAAVVRELAERWVE